MLRVCVLSYIWFSVTPLIVAFWTSLSIPGRNTGMGCYFLLQGMFPAQGLNPRFLHWQADSLLLSYLESPYRNHTHIYTADLIFI